MTMSDHQDSEHFMGLRTENEIELMLDKAERKRNYHRTMTEKCRKTEHMKDMLFHMRNYKALEGVVKALRWALGDKNVEHPLE